MKASPFFHQAQLMLRILPHVEQEQCFALKGGTAINLFVRELPRLSVDMDLTYLPLEPRRQSLKNISDALQRITTSVKKSLPGIQMQSALSPAKDSYKLFARYNNALVKIEPNLIIRGTVFPAEERELSKAAQDMFGMFVSLPVVSMADLYGGKLCAALDRQHPRDIYDVKILLENEGLTKDIMKAFVVYLSSHDRPMHEVLNPSIKDIKPVYRSEFSGMTMHSVSLEELVELQKQLGAIVRRALSDKEKRFLVSFKEGTPDWGLLGTEGVEKLPALQWKLMNIPKMEKRKHQEYVQKLRQVLGL